MDLLAAQLYAESNFNPFARSPAGAQGIAQFMPGTARAYGLANPFDPERAIDAQARLMGDLLKRFGGRPALALAAYNAGPGAVDRHGGVPPFGETRAYVAKILGLLGGAGQIPGRRSSMRLVESAHCRLRTFVRSRAAHAASRSPSSHGRGSPRLLCTCSHAAIAAAGLAAVAPTAAGRRLQSPPRSNPRRGDAHAATRGKCVKQQKRCEKTHRLRKGKCVRRAEGQAQAQGETHAAAHAGARPAERRRRRRHPLRSGRPPPKAAGSRPGARDAEGSAPPSSASVKGRCVKRCSGGPRAQARQVREEEEAEAVIEVA